MGDKQQEEKYEEKNSLDTLDIQKCKCGICCSLPHGDLMIIPMALLVMAFILSLVTLFSCKLMYVDVDNTDFFLKKGKYEIGLFTFYNKTQEQCRAYLTKLDDEGYYQMRNFGSAFRAAQFFGVASTVFGGVAMLTTTCTACVACFKPNFFKVSSLVICAVCLFQCLVFLVYAAADCKDTSNGDLGGNRCQYAKHSWILLVTCFLWAASAATLILFAKPVNEQERKTVTTVTEDKEKGIVISETVYWDGTRVIVKERKDSKTSDSLTIPVSRDIVKESVQKDVEFDEKIADLNKGPPTKQPCAVNEVIYDIMEEEKTVETASVSLIAEEKLLKEEKQETGESEKENHNAKTQGLDDLKDLEEGKPPAKLSPELAQAFKENAFEEVDETMAEV